MILEVPQPTEPATPIVPDAPVTPTVPDAPVQPAVPAEPDEPTPPPAFSTAATTRSGSGLVASTSADVVQPSASSRASSRSR